MNLRDIDFNELYKKQKIESTFQMKSKEDWDKKAISMNEKVHKSIYNDELLKEIDFGEAKSFLDVGCGVGNISIRVASIVDEVYSLDYSDTMLEVLQTNAKQKNIENINTIKTSWEDCWDDVPLADIVLASRSMEVKDMKEALLKLDSKANKRVYLTYKVGGSFIDKSILKAIDREIVEKPDYIYIINILYSLGINPTINYLRSESRTTIYNSKENFMKSIKWSLGETSKEEDVKLSSYFDNLSSNKKSEEQYNYWALISWRK